MQVSPLLLLLVQCRGRLYYSRWCSSVSHPDPGRPLQINTREVGVREVRTSKVHAISFRLAFVRLAFVRFASFRFDQFRLAPTSGALTK